MNNLLTIPSSLLSFFQLHQSPVMQGNLKNRIAFYSQLDAYYNQNGLYNPQIGSDYYLGVWDEAMKPLRDCAHRVVEFYVSKLEPGTSLPIVSANDKIIDPIKQIWQWSNFFAKKSLIVRQFALYGDLFIKTSVSAFKDSVHQQYFPPRYVMAYDEDEMGNLTYIRLDIPDDDKTHTEIWTLEGYTTYLHKRGQYEEDERYLGDPVSQDTLKSLGIDFIPFAHASFIDVGEDWGIGCFAHALDKIDEANRMATRLHEMLFRYNKALWVAQANANDSQGKPLPPPKVTGGSNTLTIEDDTILSLPGTSTLSALVPDIHYADALAILQDMMHEIERDLPELAYFDLKTSGAISGRAVEMLLGDAVDKVLETRSNFEAALIKADKHALTLGSIADIFMGIGSYDAGDFDHTINARPVFPMDDTDRAALLQIYTAAGLPLGSAMKLAGYPKDVIDEAVAGRAAENAANTARVAQAFNAGQLPTTG
jgi:hypothetical protein